MQLRRYLGVAALTLLLSAAGPVSAANEKPATATLAHIKLTGSLNEAPVAAEPFFGTGGENFKSKLDRIGKARDDSSVQGLLLEIDGLSVGWGKMDELRRAVADFRKAGKKAYAYLPSGDTRDYVLATACDEVVMPESGSLMLTGVRAEVTFYKDLLDKIGVRADMLQMGSYKGAAEPFTRSSMSKEFRSQLEKVLDDYYANELVGLLVESRADRKQMTAEEVKKLIDEGPYSARAAAKAGLIDRVAYLDDLPRDLKGELKADRVKVEKNYEQAKVEDLKLTSPWDIVKMLNPVKAMGSGKAKVAVIYASGIIVTGKSGDDFLEGEVIGSTTMIDAIREAEEDKTVKAIVLRVDSPGGSALASDLIWNELRHCKKPVVASMSDVAASGGYYISMGARKIYAEPGTLTGSIGVVGGKVALGGLFDKVGVTTETLSRGANANLLSPLTPFSNSERKAMTAVMRDTYDQFLEKAAEGRRRAGKDISKDDLEKNLAGGRVWTGRQAKENGLVDELGMLRDAIAEAKKQAGMPADQEPEILQLPRPKSLLDTLLDLKSETRSPAVGVRQLPLLRELPEVTRAAGSAEALLRLRGEPVWVVLPYRVEVR
jgi:protease-4